MARVQSEKQMCPPIFSHMPSGRSFRAIYGNVCAHMHLIYATTIKQMNRSTLHCVLLAYITKQPWLPRCTQVPKHNQLHHLFHMLLPYLTQNQIYQNCTICHIFDGNIWGCMCIPVSHMKSLASTM